MDYQQYVDLAKETALEVGIVVRNAFDQEKHVETKGTCIVGPQPRHNNFK